MLSICPSSLQTFSAQLCSQASALGPSAQGMPPCPGQLCSLALIVMQAVDALLDAADLSGSTNVSVPKWQHSQAARSSLRLQEALQLCYDIRWLPVNTGSLIVTAARDTEHIAHCCSSLSPYRLHYTSQ